MGGDVNFNKEQGVRHADAHYLQHETGHALGLYDQDLQNRTTKLGPWNIMANIWAEGAYGVSAWDRYIQGWLSEDEYLCIKASDISKLRATIFTASLGSAIHRTQAIFIQKSPYEAIVIESPLVTESGNPRTKRSQALIYSVNFLKGQTGEGYLAIPRQGFQDPELSDAALIQGEYAKSGGLTFKSVAATKKTVTIAIERR